MKLFEEYKKEFGSVVVEGVEYALMDNSNYDNDGSAPNKISFFSDAISKDQSNKIEGEYNSGVDEHTLVTWYPCIEWVNGEDDGDDGNACDWDNPDLIETV